MNVYEIITDRITEKMEQGIIPWRRPWNSLGAAKNLITKKEYRGINTFLLACSGFSNPHFLTFKQCEELGGSIKAGSKGFPVVFWKWGEYEKEKADGSTETVEAPILRYYTVFNVEQTEGIDPAKIPALKDARETVGEIPGAESIIAAMPKRPEIKHEENRAYYRPSADFVNMPKKEMFADDPHYYSVLFHELTHSTGHSSRLGRHDRQEFITHNWGDANYAREELVAEMGSAFLMGTVGLDMPDIENSAGYIQSWLKALKNDKRMVVMAAAQAQKAADYILGSVEGRAAKDHAPSANVASVAATPEPGPSPVSVVQEFARASYEADRLRFDEWREVLRSGIKAPVVVMGQADVRGEYRLLPVWMKNRNGRGSDEVAQEARERGLLRDSDDLFQVLMRVKAPVKLAA